MKIDLEAMEKTKELCHQELDNMTLKYNTSHFQMICRYAIQEFKKQFILAMIGLFMVCLVSSFNNQSTFLCILVYFMVLGSLAVLEHLKNELYGMKELISIAYIHEARGFLYRSVIMALFQLIAFAMLYVILSFNNVLLIKAIIYSLCPIYLAQIICLYFVKYVNHVFYALVAYFSFYIVFIFIMEYLSIVDYISISMTLSCLLGIAVLYIVNIALLYQKRKEGDMLWN